MLSIVAYVIGGIFSLVVLVWVMAQFKICFTVPTEGEAQAIMRGGECAGFVWAFKGHKQLCTVQDVIEYKRLHPESSHVKKWEIVPLEDGETDASILSWFNRILSIIGVRFYGISPFYSIYRYEFGWTTVKTRENRDGTRTNAVLAPLCRKEWVSSVYLKEYPYYSELIGPTRQSDEGILMRFSYLMFGRCTNPFTMLFEQTRWFDGATGITDQAAIHYLGTTRYQDINVGKPTDAVAGTGDEGEVGSFGSWFKEEIDYIRANFGFTITAIRPFSKEPEGQAAKDFVESLSAEETAKRTGKAVEETAKHQAAADTSMANARGALTQQTTVAVMTAAGTLTQTIGNQVVEVVRELRKPQPPATIPSTDLPEGGNA